MIKDSGERTEFGTGAVRDMHSGKGRMDLLPWEALVEVSKHCEEGALKYGERNCEKGIPIHSLIDSAFRHLAKYMMGMDDEPHLRAACWNCLFALYMEIKHPELQDIPTRMKEGQAEERALDQEIKKQIVENDRAFDMDKESSILWMLHTQFGFGPKRLKLAWKLFYAETLKLREHYLMEQADDGWLARKKLKDIGCDIEEWYREEGGKTDA